MRNSSINPLYKRLWNSLNRQGFKNSMMKLYPILHDRYFDNKYGVETCKWERLDQLQINSRNANRANWYEPARVLPLRKMFDTIDPLISDDSVLVDFGCGKGRILLIASQYGFVEARGVEFAGELVEIANKNCELFKKRGGSKIDFKIIKCDATDYTVRPDENVFIFYNPFDEVIMEVVIENISASIKEYPRDNLIIYAYPVHEGIMELRADIFKILDMSFYGHDFKVYSMR